METSETVEPKKPRKPRRRKAVLDRIEDGKWAVLLVGYKEVEKVIPVEQLPPGTKAGAWLKLRVQDEGVSDIIVDDSATQEARGRVESKLERLRSRQSKLRPISAAEVQDSSNRLQNPPQSGEAGTVTSDK